MTPFMCAAEQGHADCVQTLIQRGADAHKRSKSSCRSAVHYAALNGDKETLLAVLDAGLRGGARRTRLCRDDSTHVRCRRGHCECVQLLLHRGADASRPSQDGRTSAHYAAIGGHLKALAEVLDAGCSVDAADSLSLTPLISAASQGHADCVQLLLQHGADTNKRTKAGADAAHYAAQQGHAEALRALLDAGHQIDTLDGSWDDPYSCTLQEMAIPNACSCWYNAGATSRQCTKDGCTLAHLAAQNGHLETLVKVLDAGCDVNAPDSIYVTPLMCAAQEGHDDIIQLLMQRGADVHRQSKYEHTAAHYAAYTGHLQTLRALFLAQEVTSEVVDGAAEASFVDVVSYALACGCHFYLTSEEIEKAAESKFSPTVRGFCSLHHAL